VKPPKYGALHTKQRQHKAGLNPFAVELLAEAFAAHRHFWGEDTVCVIGWGKDRAPVYICLSSIPPEGVEGPTTAAGARGAGGGDLVIDVRALDAVGEIVAEAGLARQDYVERAMALDKARELAGAGAASGESECEDD
jgi:hypothetical protein